MTRAFREHPGMIVGLIVIVAFGLAALFAPLPHNPLAVDAFHTLRPPSATYWFGTDQNGGDVFSRIIAAARLDLPLAISGAILSAIIGVPLGLLASASGRSAGLIVRALDIFQSFPLLVLSIIIIALSGNKIQNVTIAIVLVNTPQFIRLVRSEALAIRSSRFIEAANAIGASRARVTFLHVLPNVTGTVFSQLSLSVGQGILVIAALAFIGVGIVPPAASWGSMIRSGTPFIVTGQWWLALAPGLAILVFVMSFNAIAEGVEASLKATD